MTDTANTTTTVVTSIAKTVATDAQTAATTEVASLSSHWHVPVWAVIAILGVAAVIVLHFI